MIFYIITQDKPYDLLPYQIKSCRTNGASEIYCVQISNDPIDEEFIKKFSAKNLEIEKEAKTYEDAVNYVLYEKHIKPEAHDNIVFLSQNILFDKFKFIDKSTVEGMDYLAISTAKIDQTFELESHKYLFSPVPKKHTYQKYTLYKNGVIKFGDDIEYIRNKFGKFIPNSLKLDNPVVLAGRLIKENNKFRKSAKEIRTPEEQKDIYDNICKPCDHYKNSRCLLCGCHLKGVLNKIKYKSSHCPIKKW